MNRLRVKTELEAESVKLYQYGMHCKWFIHGRSVIFWSKFVEEQCINFYLFDILTNCKCKIFTEALLRWKPVSRILHKFSPRIIFFCFMVNKNERINYVLQTIHMFTRSLSLMLLNICVFFTILFKRFRVFIHRKSSNPDYLCATLISWLCLLFCRNNYFMVKWFHKREHASRCKNYIS